MFNEDDTETVLMVDASNAFNSINREPFFHNAKVLCPALATFINSSSTIPIDLFVQGRKRIKSLKGTTQGDPALMAIFCFRSYTAISMIKQFVKRKKQVPIKASSICR